MKLGLLLLLALPAAAQNAPDTTAWTWFSRETPAGTTYGYQDASGRVRIPARFGGFTRARRFHHIAAVREDQAPRSYYLLKSGRQVGIDSVFVFDFQFDCESEGKIRFKDPRRNRVGFLDHRGKVVIPALYNYVTPFYNGLAVGLIGARQTCDHDPDTVQCEHPGWIGGRTVLLNARHEVLINDLATVPTGSGYLNWYSLKINDPAPDTATTTTLRVAGGDRYTFTDYDKEFRTWFYGVFVPTARTGSAAQLQALCFADLAVAARPFRGWPHFTPATLLARYGAALRLRLGGLRRGMANTSIFSGDLNKLIFSSRAFEPFLTDCGEHFRERYPVWEVMLTYPAGPTKSTASHQEHFEFIRTAAGYRLLSVSF